MPRDPQGAGTRTETKVEWRNVYERAPLGMFWDTREEADDAARATQEFGGDRRIAIERIETTTTITREEL